MKRLRILALNWRCLRHPQAGGSETNLFEQAGRWVRDGHEVTLLCASAGPDVGAREQVNGIDVRRMGGRFTLYVFVAFFLLRHASNFDVVLDVANGIPFFAPLWTRRRGVLLVHHVHDKQWFTELGWLLGWVGWALERWAVPLVYRSWQVIAVSPSTREALIELGIRSEQIQIIYNGLSTPLIPSLNAHPSCPRIVYVGRVRRYKRVDLLIRAVAGLRQRIPTLRLDIAGDGDARPELEKLAAELGVDEHVTIHGYVSAQQKADLLAAATVFATASTNEGWGIAVIEANAYGCPAVAFDVPGLRSAIQQGVTGLLASDVIAFEHALETLLRDRTLRDHLGAAALSWSRQFDWEHSAALTLAMLHEASRGPLALAKMQSKGGN
ncbi:MAG TPA: glycosyltransferase family 4 protein [Roseiflexaceae bacterium]|nr:glycosyltransferase family 4 protein [Roseiflexaceae bacterium]